MYRPRSWPRAAWIVARRPYRRDIGIVVFLLLVVAAANCHDNPLRPPIAPALVVVTPDSTALGAPGATIQLKAEARNASGDSVGGQTFVWTSSDSTKARVSSTGLVTAVAYGSVTVTATAAGVSGSAKVSVNWLAEIVVSPAGLNLPALGFTAQLDAVALDAGGYWMSGLTFVWASSDPAVIRVSEWGQVTAVADGSATISATAGSVTGSAAVTVHRVVLQEPTRITAGAGHSCALAAGGVAHCWGGNSWGQLGNGTSTSHTRPARVSMGNGLRTIDAGFSHTCGITTSGRAYCWGMAIGDQLGIGEGGNYQATPVPLAQGLVFVAISAGGYHTCGLTGDGAAYCWGQEEVGQLGDGTLTRRNTPAAVAGGLVFKAISAGGNHTCAIATGGAAYCWGGNGSGALGDGTLTDRSTPVAVSGGLLFQAISAGNGTTCGLTADGAAFCWGQDAWSGSRTAPVAVGGGLVFKSIVVGYRHACGFTAGGTAYCWGDDGLGQLGDGTQTSRRTPVAVSGGLVFQAAGAGDSHTCGLSASGTAYCWGSNSVGQLGDGRANALAGPVPVAGGLVFQNISASECHTCGLATGGTVHCWGDNAAGQLGDGSGTNQASPVAVGGGPAFQAICTGFGHSCGLSTSGAAYYWGLLWYEGPTVLPRAVSGGVLFQAISTGRGHTCGLSAGGAAYCWGDNAGGQLGIGRTGGGSASPVQVSGNVELQAVVAGWFHTCGLSAGGSAYCWGQNLFGRLGDGGTTDRSSPSAVSGGLLFRTLTLGDLHTCGIAVDGATYCWGVGHALGDGTRTISTSPVRVAGNLVFQAISAGKGHTCALTTSGAAYCWGLNAAGQLGIGAPSFGEITAPVPVAGGLVFQAISAGSRHTCALTRDGAAYCWGTDSYGEIGGGSGFRTVPVAVAGGITFGVPSVRSRTPPSD